VREDPRVKPKDDDGGGYPRQTTGRLPEDDDGHVRKDDVETSLAMTLKINVSDGWGYFPSPTCFVNSISFT
jgi:hypothetical protein